MKLVGWPDEAVSLGLSTVAALVVIVVTPCIGWLSDRVDRKAVLLAMCAACAALPFAMFSLIAGGKKPAVLFAVMVLAALAGGVSAVGAVATAEQFPAHARLSGLAVGATTATAIFGGAATYPAYLLQTWSGATGTPGIMIAVVATVSGLILLCAMPGRPESSRRGG